MPDQPHMQPIEERELRLLIAANAAQVVEAVRVAPDVPRWHLVINRRMILATQRGTRRTGNLDTLARLAKKLGVQTLHVNL